MTLHITVDAITVLTISTYTSTCCLYEYLHDHTCRKQRFVVWNLMTAFGYLLLKCDVISYMRAKLHQERYKQINYSYNYTSIKKLSNLTNTTILNRCFNHMSIVTLSCKWQLGFWVCNYLWFRTIIYTYRWH